MSDMTDAGFYDDYWRSRGTSTGPQSEIFETAEALLPGPGVLLDAGCGPGFLYPLVKARFSRVCGIDVSPAAAEEAMRKGVDAVVGDLSRLPWGEGTFDACAMLDVLEHVRDPLAVLKEALRVLKPGGRLILSTPNIRCFRHIWTLAVSGLFPNTADEVSVWGGGHLHYFTRRDISFLLNSAGFSKIDFVLNPGQFARSGKRRAGRLLLGGHLFGEFFEGSVFASA